jgi:hypothetical protein
MEMTQATASYPVTVPKHFFRLDLKPDGFFNVYPSTTVYGVGIKPGLTASGTSGVVYRDDSNFDGKNMRVYFGFTLERVPMNRNPWKDSYSLRVHQDEEDLFQDNPELQFKDGMAFLAKEGIIARAGVLTVELARQGRELFALNIPIDVDGWPTSGAAFEAYGPTRLKTVQRDEHGRIAAIVEQIG